MNLLKETIDELAAQGKTLNDIEWIGNRHFQLPLDDLHRLFDVDYDNGYGGTEIAYDLLVVGDGWWLERHEYDGKEWWAYYEPPVKPTEVKTLKRIDDGWHSLGDILQREEYLEDD